MRLKEIDLHGKNVAEAKHAVNGCIEGLLKHRECGVVFIHGKGIHSGKRAKLKQEIREILNERNDLEEAGYMVIHGEEPYAITDIYDEGNVLVVKRGYENESSSEGEKQKQKTYIVKSQEGRELRRNAKKHSQSRNKKRPGPPFQKDNKDAALSATIHPEDKKTLSLVSKISQKVATEEKNKKTQTVPVEPELTISPYQEIDLSKVDCIDDVKELRNVGDGWLFRVKSKVSGQGILAYHILHGGISDAEKCLIQNYSNKLSIDCGEISSLLLKDLFIPDRILPMNGNYEEKGDLLLVSRPVNDLDIRLISGGTHPNICDAEYLKKEGAAILAKASSIISEEGIVANPIRIQCDTVNETLMMDLPVNIGFRNMKFAPYSELPQIFLIPKSILTKHSDQSYKEGDAIIIYRLNAKPRIRAKIIH